MEETCYILSLPVSKVSQFYVTVSMSEILVLDTFKIYQF